MRREATLVTVVVPVLDEAADIGRALDAVAEQDHPLASIELVVVDGGSTDGTERVVEEWARRARLRSVRVVRCRDGSTPGNLNAGLAVASGDVVCRVDARSIVPPHYVRRCVELLDEDHDRVVVGGAQVAVPRDGSVLGQGIARALNNRWGMGLASYRRGGGSGPVDTVYLGAFRTAQLREAGGWDERFPTNQDFELNRRLGRRGIVWFDAGIEVGYLGRASIGGLFRQYRRFGSWKVRYWRTTGDRPRPRQAALLAVGPLALLAAVASVLLPARARAALLAAGAIGAVLVDATGSRPGPAPPTVRAVALVASAAIAAGWTAGVWSELVRGET